MIAIGGAIGTGLFMGSGKTISLAGPSILLVYAIIGGFLFFVMRAMGELLLSNLNYKSFRDIAEDILGPWAGFFAGWTYWFCWIVIGVADLTAVTAYAAYWFPDLPKWVAATSLVLLLLVLNLVTVKLFGEIEFWFALIKIVAIVGLVVVAVLMVVSGFISPDGHQANIANLWSDGGFFPRGSEGFLAGFQIAFFAFLGIELVGTAAAETEEPEGDPAEGHQRHPDPGRPVLHPRARSDHVGDAVAIDQSGDQPVRVDVQPGRARTCCLCDQLRRAHQRSLVRELRHLLHLADALRAGAGPEGPTALRRAVIAEGAGQRPAVLLRLPAPRAGAAVHDRLDPRGLHTGHVCGVGAVHLRLGADHGVLPRSTGSASPRRTLLPATRCRAAW